ncbi:hypothetical protein GQ53DRAFT_228108 [Thozetella sp. PMI_491]|nr:hypothetical protein GQ53DRAFT_228108 [Thozetella sp. PMI_491]
MPPGGHTSFVMPAWAASPADGSTLARVTQRWPPSAGANHHFGVYVPTVPRYLTTLGTYPRWIDSSVKQQRSKLWNRPPQLWYKQSFIQCLAGDIFSRSKRKRIHGAYPQPIFFWHTCTIVNKPASPKLGLQRS